MDIRPFQGLVPAPDKVEEIACVPYDVVDRDEAAALAEGKPLSLLNVDRAEIRLPPDTDPYADIVYRTAAATLMRFVQQGALKRETRPCFYLYRQVMGAHSQTGIAALSSVQDYEEDRIKKHEKTRPAKENDRLRLIDTIGAQTGPVFLAFRDDDEIPALMKASSEGEPTCDFTAPDGVRHTVWRIEIVDPWQEYFARMPATYIADGHHRAASAARVAQLRRERNQVGASDPGGSSGAPRKPAYEFFLTVLFPASQLKVLPYNRLVLDLNGHRVSDLLKHIGRRFSVREAESPTPSSPRHIAMYLSGKWHKLSWHEDPSSSPADALDVSVLQEQVLSPLLGIENPRTDPRIEFVGGIRGTDHLARRVDSGSAAVAFSMYPTTIEQVMAIADAGQIMPPKSTWFEPKLRSGLFIHVLDGV